MLNSIHIKNAFTHKDRKITFEKGLSRLSGPNEAGKSLIFEMIRYALFGTKALRGSAKDYKNVEVTLVFTVGDSEYEVYRGPKEVVLNKDNKFLARSTTAVNAKIIQIIGYGLHTFDNVNNITQNEIEKLTKMDARDRKKFLDQLVKADQIDNLIKDYAAEEKLSATEATALKAGIFNVDQPDRPKQYLPPEKAEAKVVEAANVVRNLEDKKAKYDLLRSQAMNLIILPDPYPHMSAEELSNVLDRQLERKKFNQDIVRLFEASLSIHDFGQYLETCRTLRQSEKLQKPRLTREEISRNKEKWIEQNNWEQLTRLRQQIADMESCPRCGLSFEGERAPLVEKINELEPLSRPHRGLPSPESLEEMQTAWDAWDAIEEPNPEYAGIIRFTGSNPSFSKEEYEQTMKQLQDLEGLPTPKDVNQSLASKQRAADKANYISESEKLDFSGLEDAKATLTAAIAHRQLCANYDASSVYWTQVQQKNKELEDKIAKAEEDAAEKKKVVKALQDFKYYINTYFLPSVAKAGSKMLKTMTNGTRKRLSITDKFDISVDGQAVETLSGSAKALVNIALRLALQYVLTKNSFSVFMGDEIDASMDDNRAKYLSECLTNMTDHIEQIVVISHRDITAHHQIKL